MDTFEKKTFTTSRNLTYTYYISAPTPSNKTLPTLLFHHGWPDHAKMYSPIISHLQKDSIPNRMLVPDMLGYGGTSKPTTPSSYKYDGMTNDMIEILDSESISTVISIGHDWGSQVAQRLYNYHPTRVSGLICLNVTYSPPSRQPFALDAANALTTKVFGYPTLAYWYLFAHPEGPEVLGSNPGRLFSALHAAGPDAMKQFFCVRDAVKSYILSDGPEVEVRAYAKESGLREAFVERMTRDGFQGAQQWYVATAENHQFETDKTLPEERDRVGVPVLFVGGKEDAVCRPEAVKASVEKGLLPDFEEYMIQAAHWSVYEKPAEMAGYIGDWLNRKGFVGGKK